MSNLKCYW